VSGSGRLTDSNAWTRRDTIGGVILATAVLGVPALVVRLSGPAGEKEATDRQKAIATRVAQLVIPATDTPGGGDVGAGDFLVLALAHGLDETGKPAAGDAIQGANASYRRADGSLDHLSWLEDSLDTHAGGDFLAAPIERQQAALELIDRAAFAAPMPSGPWAKIKGLLLTGYYTSEAGGSKELRYELVPGRFDADIPLRPTDRAWSSDWTAVEFG